MALVTSAKALGQGDMAPSFTLKSTSQPSFSLYGNKGQLGTVIIFMCNHCPYVKFKLPRILQLAKTYLPQGIGFIGINSNDTEQYPDDAFVKMPLLGLPFPYLIDETQNVARAYGATCTPDPFIFDKDLKLVYHGRFDNALNPGEDVIEHIFEAVLDAMLASKPVEEWFKPSIGCSIKWKP